MNNTVNSPEFIRHKKFAILLCGVVLYFLTSMSKLLVPGIIFDDLQKIGMDARMISATGASFMYAYAVSQLLAGLFSNRYGGVRILLIGGTLFALGTSTFPWINNYPLMIFCRILTGLGAGTVFLGVVKLINDLFPAKFAVTLGTVMLFSYCGTICGTTPMVMLVNAVRWQWAMTIPGAVAAAGVAVICLLMRGTIKTAVSGSSVKPLLKMLKNTEMWKISLAVPVVFALYYIISTQLGQKSLLDHFRLNPETASAVIMTMTIIVTLNNVAGNLLLRLFGGNSKKVIICSLIFSLTGSIAGYAAFQPEGSAITAGAAFILLAIPAGFFPLFGAAAKAVTPPEDTGLAVALLNFWCFVFIAAFQNIAGRIMLHYAVPGSLHYPPAAYQGVFIFMITATVYGLITAFCIKQNVPENHS